MDQFEIEAETEFAKTLICLIFEIDIAYSHDKINVLLSGVNGFDFEMFKRFKSRFEKYITIYKAVCKKPKVNLWMDFRDKLIEYMTLHMLPNNPKTKKEDVQADLVSDFIVYLRRK